MSDIAATTLGMFIVPYVIFLGIYLVFYDYNFFNVHFMAAFSTILFYTIIAFLVRIADVISRDDGE